MSDSGGVVKLKAPGEGFCWTCIDGPGWFDQITSASFTVLPGRER